MYRPPSSGLTTGLVACPLGSLEDAAVTHLWGVAAGLALLAAGARAADRRRGGPGRGLGSSG